MAVKRRLDGVWYGEAPKLYSGESLPSRGGFSRFFCPHKIQKEGFFCAALLPRNLGNVGTCEHSTSDVLGEEIPQTVQGTGPLGEIQSRENRDGEMKSDLQDPRKTCSHPHSKAKEAKSPGDKASWRVEGGPGRLLDGWLEGKLSEREGKRRKDKGWMRKRARLFVITLIVTWFDFWGLLLLLIVQRRTQDDLQTRTS
ncbi:hypothetical protein GWK47_037677 [Chionoecetes opilio]|uniref:Uncharacterized protein n=1 Tax=Chionoecetes opilio TaxID=41210 RepID=A0A8J5CYL4_CHIOP|nr:hypothetical protein GWK47_037677 [Chionoecetes opilio]